MTVIRAPSKYRVRRRMAQDTRPYPEPWRVDLETEDFEEAVKRLKEIDKMGWNDAMIEAVP